MLDRVVIGADDETYFIEYLPVVAKAWKKYFPEAQLTLAFVSNTDKKSELVERIRQYADVYIFPKILGIPLANQAKVSRHFLASTFENEVCMIEDIDTIPLQREFFEKKLMSRRDETLLCVGHDVYVGTPHEGKFPISTMTSEGRIFKEFINPLDLEYTELLDYWKNMGIRDRKARISSHASVFSDESLIRHLINNWTSVKITKTAREIDIKKYWIDRSWWSVDIAQLKSNEYVTCNFLRPPSQYYMNMTEIYKHIYGYLPERKEVLFEDVDSYLEETKNCLENKRILIIQENGRHEQNRHFRECYCMQRSLASLGYMVDVWGLGHENYETTPNWNSYDLIINLENYDVNNWVPNLSFTTHPKKFLWSIDAHCRSMEPFLKTYEEGKYDLILQATKDFVNEESVWFPNCYDDSLIGPCSKKSTFLGFCGSILNRKNILDFLTDKFNLRQDIWRLGQDMVQTISSYAIHFNINLANDINYRSFETLGSGTLLLTNYNPQYEELGFIDGENCLMYKNIEDLCDKLRICQKDPKLVSSITKAGLELAKEHTYNVRAKKLIDIYESLS